MHNDYINIYNKIIYNKNLKDKQFVLYGYFLSLLKDSQNILYLLEEDKIKIKKLFKYRYYYLEDNFKKDTNLLDDLNNLYNQNLIDKVDIELMPLKIKINKNFNNLEYTSLPIEIFKKVLPEINDFKIIRYLYYLHSYRNEIITVEKIVNDICKGDYHKYIQMNKLLNKYNLIDIEKLENSNNNIYKIILDKIIDFPIKLNNNKNINKSIYYCYFIQVNENGPIKIGLTNNIKARLTDLQISNPYKLNLLCIIPGSVKTEKELHKKFEKYRLNGEWFSPAQEILDYVKEIKSKS